MRNTDSGGNTRLSTAFSSRADSRSWPNGFSTTTRRHVPSPPSARPCSSSWSITLPKNFGGMER